MVLSTPNHPGKHFGPLHNQAITHLNFNFHCISAPKHPGKGSDPPQSSKWALELFLNNSSLNKCPKPSWQAFRPPAPPNGQCPKLLQYDFPITMIIDFFKGPVQLPEGWILPGPEKESPSRVKEILISGRVVVIRRDLNSTKHLSLHAGLLTTYYVRATSAWKSQCFKIEDVIEVSQKINWYYLLRKLWNPTYHRQGIIYVESCSNSSFAHVLSRPPRGQSQAIRHGVWEGGRCGGYILYR